MDIKQPTETPTQNVHVFNNNKVVMIYEVDVLFTYLKLITSGITNSLTLRGAGE